MDIDHYRSGASEIDRAADLLKLVPERGKDALDIGARDGHFSILLADRFEKVTALDLTRPTIADPRVECVSGDVRELPFPDGCFDFVLCAEVLEHLPAKYLADACREIARVSNGFVLIGVPYKQDIRVGRTTCCACGGRNPPWGHINTFDEDRLAALFSGCSKVKTTFVGVNSESTNWLATSLMDFAGNPFGTYFQDETCIHCGEFLGIPKERTFLQKFATKVAHWCRVSTEAATPSHANWIHLLLKK